MQIVNLADTPYQVQADKLADAEQRVDELETEKADAIAVEEARRMPEPALDSLSLDQLTAPAVAVAPVETRAIDEIRKDLARAQRIVELTLPLAVSAKLESTKAAITVASAALTPIIARASAKLREAVAIAKEADNVLAALEQAGYREETYDDDSVTYRTSDRALKNMRDKVAAIKDMPTHWLARMERFTKADGEESVFLRFVSSIGGVSFSYAPGDFVEWFDIDEALRLVAAGIAEEMTEATAVLASEAKGLMIRKHRPPVAEATPAPKRDIVSSLAAAIGWA